MTSKGKESMRKCECIVYCQRVLVSPVTLDEMWENVKDLKILDIVYYIFFVVMILSFFIGNRICREPATPDLKEAVSMDEEQQLTLLQRYCNSKDQVTMNSGVLFLCMIAARSYYKRISTKVENAKGKR